MEGGVEAAAVELQLEAARNAVLVVPASDLATLIVTGADRATWINGLVTCDVLARSPGEAAYGLMVAKNGRVQADLWVTVLAERIVLVVPAAQRDALRASLDHYLVMEDAEIEQGDLEVTMLHGPRAREVVERVLALEGAIIAPVHGDDLGAHVVLAPPAVADSVRVAVAARAAELGGVVGDAAGWEVVRLRHGIPRFGVDFDASTYPQEAGLERRAVSFDKGCYLGQEVVFMLEKRGHVKRKLVPIALDPGAPVPSHGAKVTDASGLEVGHVTSAARDLSTGKVHGLAMVKRAYTAPGSALRVDGAAAEVVGSSGGEEEKGKHGP